ncbi:MAG: thioesterase family protein [Nakamurella sp.]
MSISSPDAPSGSGPSPVSNSSGPAAAFYYEPLGDGRFRATEHTEGAWQSTEQHMAPVSGLLTHALEAASGRTDLITSRIAFDILGMIQRTEVQVTAEVIRPGRTIELVQAEMSAGGRALVRATGWRLTASDTSSVAGHEFESIPGPDEAEPWAGDDTWGGAFIAGLEFRVLPGWRPGRGRCWIRTPVGLIDGEPTSRLAGYLGLVDSANGIAVRRSPSEMLFPNTDLTVHLLREPQGDWVGLDTSVNFGSAGIGITSSVLHDVRGPLGIAAQTLTLRVR